MRPAHDDSCLAYFINMRGESARVLQAYDSAVVYYNRSDAIYRRLSPAFRLDIAHNVGFALLALGRSSEARSRFTEGMQHAVANADQSYIAFFLASSRIRQRALSPGTAVNRSLIVTIRLSLISP